MELSKRNLQKITAHPLFRRTDPEQIRLALTLHGHGIREIHADGLLRSPDDRAGTVGFLLSGNATVTTPDPSRSVLLRHLSAGDLFGVANLFSAEPFISTIRATTPCTCVIFSENAIFYLLEQSPAFRMDYIAFLSGRICFLNRKIGYLTAGSAERRLALYLASFEEPVIQLTESISSLSELLDLGRASIYRAFDRLQSDGFLVKVGRSITVKDRDAMLKAYQ